MMSPTASISWSDIFRVISVNHSYKDMQERWSDIHDNEMILKATRIFLEQRIQHDHKDFINSLIR